jgi:hypothetical protein
MANKIIHGRFYFTNGDTFEGMIADNFKMVEGKYNSKTWNYQGGLKTFITDTCWGSSYTVTFEGKGQLYFRAKDDVKCLYEGSFLDGNFDGQGMLFVNLNSPSQQSVVGKWLQGELIHFDLPKFLEGEESKQTICAFTKIPKEP